jgi:hypothetical protein
VTWQEFHRSIPPLGDAPSRAEWQAALDHARSLLPQVDAADRGLAEEIIGDSLIQAGVFLGFVSLEMM